MLCELAVRKTALARTTRSHNPDAHHTLNCTHCKVVFPRPKYVRSGENPFCSRGCFQAYAAENYTQQMPLSYGKSWIARRKRTCSVTAIDCQHCQSDSDLVVHHIREYRLFSCATDAHELDNLVTLCVGLAIVANIISERLFPL